MKGEPDTPAWLTSMKVVLCQANIAWENKEKNYSHIEKYLRTAYEKSGELFLLPEMSFTGFSMNTNVTKEADYETVNRVTEYAQKYDLAIGFGWVRDCGEKSENHYTVVNRKGEIISDYIKIHPFSFSGEDQKFLGGENIRFFELCGIKFSTFICYDLRFPEIFQIASKEANAIMVPANWPASRSEHWRCLLKARAIENQVYILAINCVGEVGDLRYSGNSCIINPSGKVLVELSDEENVLEFELVNDVEEFRNVFPMKKDRRENLYCSLY